MLKIKCVSIAFAAMFAFTFLTPQSAIAQTSKVSQAVAKAHSVQSLPVCSDVVPGISKKLQAKANKNCTTQKTCVKCKLSKTGDVIFADLIIQPKGKCPNSVRAVEDSALDPNSNATKPAPNNLMTRIPEADFGDFDIIQSLCEEGGTTLSIYIPGADFENPDWLRKTYSFLWEVDGKKAGHEDSVKCACGNNASVRVTEFATGRKVKKEVALRGCEKGPSKNTTKSAGSKSKN